MCGICGGVNLAGEAFESLAALERMNRVLRHRGPDDTGSFVSGPVGLGMRRLSIIDVEGGRQPISNEDDTIQVVFNGEIYNFQELRQRLTEQGHRFRTKSDTEVLVHLYEESGPELVHQLTGMFAFALWDGRAKRLLLARDRLGIKPLYYTVQHGQLLFASELKALLQHPRVSRRLHLEALDAYMTYGYLPAPLTPFEGIHKLPPATRLVCEAGGVTTEPYWRLDYRQKLPGTLEELGEAFLRLLQQAVRSHQISDVPLGAFLSGGLDSSTIVALMAAEAGRRLNTFSIGYGDGDELRHAAEVAAYLGTKHRSMRLDPSVVEQLPDLVWHQDEPLFDNSILPTYAVSGLARADVTVALSGDGGDELLAGYEWLRREHWTAQYRRLPAAMRRLLAARLAGPGFQPGYERGWFNRLQRFVYDAEQDLPSAFARRTTVGGGFRRALYADGLRAGLGEHDAASIQREAFREAPVDDEREAMLWVDTRYFLPDDCLMKVDRMSMAHSLEVRVPFLDHRVVEFAARVPYGFKIQGATTKRLLKRVMRGRLPRAVLRQRKQGFTVPIGRWLQEPLLGRVEHFLVTACHGRGLFRAETVRWMCQAHREGTHEVSGRLWSLLVWELWCRQYLDGPTAEPPGRSLRDIL